MNNFELTRFLNVLKENHPYMVN